MWNLKKKKKHCMEPKSKTVVARNWSVLGGNKMLVRRFEKSDRRDKF